METDECIRHMIEKTGMSARQVSREMSNGENFISVALHRKSDVRAGTLARIAGTMGYRLVLVNEDGTDEVVVG